MYDYIIIGGGPAGLYCAWKLEQKSQDNIMIVEKNSYLGGRTRVEDFHSVKVNTGAGVGRWKKDSILKSLTHKVSPKMYQWKSKICYDHFEPVSCVTLVNQLKNRYTRKQLNKLRHHFNFRTFFLKHYPMSIYKRFCLSNGYTDFQKADIIDTMDDYGFDDNVPGTPLFKVPWNDLIKYLQSQLKHTQISLNKNIIKYTTKDGIWILTDDMGRTYQCKKLVIAGFVAPCLPKDVKQQIGINTFMRIYAYAKHGFDPKNCMIYRKDELQKTIPMTEKVQMICYNDNRNSEIVYNEKNKKKALEKMMGQTFEDYKEYYWKAGTHYYKPLSGTWRTRNEFLKYAQHPKPSLFVVGEMVSRNQGWTEGAFESVEKILHRLITSS